MPPMSTPGSRAIAVGFTIILFSVSVGIHFLGAGGFGLFTGVLAGANLLTVGVSMDGHLVVLDGARALAVFVRRNTAVVGLIMASCAVTAVSGEAAGPMLCFAMFALLLLGLTLINIGARGE